MATKQKKWAATEKLQVTCTNQNKEVFYITQNSATGIFFLYKESDGEIEKIASKNVKNPLVFDEIIFAKRKK